ncbi:hypothetical protein KR018_001214, partial [Drosophila ironensis]
FKDMVRLTQGISNIYSHQVERLLGGLISSIYYPKARSDYSTADDTRLLLEQTRRTTLSFEKITHESVEVEVRTHKRKRVITKKATITKRARFSEPNLLDSPTREYYSQMLFDSEQWQTESPEEVQEELQNSIETRCTYELTISEEIETQDHQAGIFPSDGFGETEPDLSIFEELYPRRTACESKFPFEEIQNPTDTISSIIARLDSPVEEIQNPTDIISSITLRLESTTKEPATGIVSEPVDLPRNRQRKSKKGKLLIDNCIKYSKDQLMKHRKKYAEDSMDRIIVATLATEQMKKASVLLSNLEKRSVFPDLLKNLKIKKEEVKDEGENILRSIFGDDYNEDIAEEILRPKPSQKTRKKSQPLEIIPVSTSPIIEPNNNNLWKHKLRIRFYPGSYSIMMDLLQIWRNHLDVEGIDAEEFIKSFRSRAKAALAFNYLLYLSRDKFIKITKKPNSLKMDTILIGEESRKLIENVAEETISETI